ncbi:nitroreductase family deazaflavin-dependent oxidoreductase [Gordonia sp. DT219]|uniref:nitroreductase family deazaflavin-dependent oxidoreductase n=1 Tax=Gordonia sp. DT219 TaxID=3416658 RepID=UPI003CEE76C4
MASITDRVGAYLLRNRSVVRAPIWLYRHDLGWLLGRRVLMLEHLGRRSGLPRYVCLEVVDRPSADVLVVVSGFGTSSQWYRNLMACPECKVSIGTARNKPARARPMSDEESAETLQRYQQAHPRAWRNLRGMIEQATDASVTTLPMVALGLADVSRSAGGPDHRSH